MNKEEIEKLEDFTIDITDIDELALGLEVCSKKSNMVIQEFADLIIKLQQENKQLKEKNKSLEKQNEYLRNNEYLNQVKWERDMLEDVCDTHKEMIDHLQNKIDKATDTIQYIIDYGFDYDGFNNEKDLKGLIDMLVDYAEKSKDILKGE